MHGRLTYLLDLERAGLGVHDIAGDSTDSAARGNGIEEALSTSEHNHVAAVHVSSVGSLHGAKNLENGLFGNGTADGLERAVVLRRADHQSG